MPDGAFQAFEDLARLYYFAYESRSRILRRHRAMVETQQMEGDSSEQLPPVSVGILAQFADNIVAKIDEAVHNEKELSANDFDRISRLAERLSQGILIGSYPDKAPLDAALHQFASIELGLHHPVWPSLSQRKTNRLPTRR